MTPKLGAQLYTVRNYIQNEQDFARSMKRVADIGYQSVQISGVSDFDAKAYRNICDANGIEIGLTHTDFNKILKQTDKVIEDHQILGAPYIGIGSMPERYRDAEWIDFFADDCAEAAEKIAASGMKLMYHNHGFEFQTHKNGRDLLECLSDKLSADKLGFTLDVFWVQAGGKDVLRTMEQHKDRLDCIHLKDFKSTQLSLFFAEVGEGSLDMKAIIAAAERAGTKYMFVEQDNCYGTNPFDALKTSYDNITTKILG